MNSDDNNGSSNEQNHQKYYFGNALVKKRASGDEFFVVSIDLTRLDEIIEKNPGLVHVSKANKRYLKAVINPYMSGPNQHGNTHSLAVDTYRPAKKENNENYNNLNN